MYRYLLLFILLFMTQPSFAQCPNRAITLSRQSDIDSFKYLFPNCTEIGTQGLSINTIYVKNLDSLSVLTKIYGFLNISSLDSLKSIKGLKNVTEIANLSIGSNPSLVSLEGLNSLTTAGIINITRNNLLVDLNGLNQLKSCGFLAIGNNQRLTSFNGLNSIDSVRTLYIEGNNNVSNFEGMRSLRVSASISLFDTKIPSLEGFRNIKTLSSFFLNAARNLKNLTGLNNLATITNTFDIKYNDSLQNMIGLENLTSIGGKVSILYHGKLKNLEGLNQLKSIGSNLTFSSNNNLSMTGLNKLDSIGGDVDITSNRFLATLNGMDSLRIISGFLRLISNDSLTSLQGLRYLKNVKSDIYIYNIPVSNCAIQAVCQKFLTGNSSNLYFSNNRIGCNSKSEVEPSCRALKTNDVELPQLSIAPNPSVNHLFLTLKNISSQILTIEIVDLLGKRLFMDKITPNTEGSLIYPLSVEGWRAGIYIVKISNSSFYIQQKIIKQ